MKGYKQPVSVLVLVYTPALEVLLLERADFPDHWQSVTGSCEPGEPLERTAVRELMEETGIDAMRYGGVVDWQCHNDFEIFAQWAHRYPPGTTHNREHVFALEVPERVPVRLHPREHRQFAWLPWREAAVRCFSWTNRAAIEQLPERVREGLRMLKALALAGFALAASGSAHAQIVTRVDSGPTPQAVLTVSAAATTSIANDRMHAWLRAEADGADATQAGNDVNARMARALARAKGVRGIDAATSGYSTYQIESKDRAPRWRVSQTLTLQSSDFLALAALVSRLQADDGLLISGMSFSITPEKQRATEDALIAQAIKSWQQRAQVAAQAFGSSAWRPGHVAIQTSDGGRPQPMLRAQALAANAPVNVEGGRSEVSVTVTGEAILETERALPR